MRLTFRQTHLYRFVNMAEMERFELSRRFEPTYRISSVVKLWQIHVWSRSFQATLLRGRNADAARGCGHSDPYRPEAIRTAPKFK